MRKLSLYILRQILGPFLLFTLLLTLVVWMTQSLRLLDLVINRGQSAGIFAYLTLLMLPSLLVVIVPIAFFGAALFALNKLNHDSELVVMWSAGLSRVQMAAPVIAAAAMAMALTYLCSLYLMPLGQRLTRDKVFEIRADIGAAILREGAFTTPSEGLTVFIRELSPTGEIKGILVHDNRDLTQADHLYRRDGRAGADAGGRAPHHAQRQYRALRGMRLQALGAEIRPLCVRPRRICGTAAGERARDQRTLSLRTARAADDG